MKKENMLLQHTSVYMQPITVQIKNLGKLRHLLFVDTFLFYVRVWL